MFIDKLLYLIMLYIILLSLLHTVVADLLPLEPYYPPDGVIPNDNIFIKALLTMSACACVGLCCEHKIPLKIIPTDEHSYDGIEHFQIESDKKSTKNYKQDIRKLKRDLRELQSVLSKLDRS